MFIIALVSVGYHEPLRVDVANAANANIVTNINKTSVDNVVAITVAASVASNVNLPIATSVVNMAITAQTKSDYTQSDGVSVVKPQIISSVDVNRSVFSYVVVDGDTVESVAAKYNISVQTLKWANNLTSDALFAGKTLRILPIDGVLYSVKSGDTIDLISSKYVVDQTRLVVYNDLDVSGIKEGDSIILPGGILPEKERPGYVAPVIYTSYGTGFGGNTWRISSGTSSNSFYAYGNCTAYAYNRRVQLGLYVGNHWGNASSWDENAASEGLLVDHTPSVGAIIQNNGGLGHVGIVEELLPNGDVSISEMNAGVSGGGWNIVSGRIILSGNVSQYNYIH